MADLSKKVLAHLEKVRNDGNKTYEVTSISKEFAGEALKDDDVAGEGLEGGDDLFATVKITIDQSKTVAPITS